MSSILFALAIVVIGWFLLGLILLALLYAYGEDAQRQPAPDKPVDANSDPSD